MKMVRVGDVAEQLRGVTFSKADAVLSPREGYVAILTAGNIQDGRLVTSDLTYVPATKVSTKQQVRLNDVVICTSSGSLRVVGKAAQSDGTFLGGFGAFLKVLRPGSEVDPRYFAHYFQTRSYRQTVSALAEGANINNLKNEHLDDLFLPVPPLPEQRRIAAILDHADAIRAKRRQVLAHLDSLIQATYIDMFEGATWPSKPLVDLADSPDDIKCGPFGTQLNVSEFRSSGVPLLGIKNVNAKFELPPYEFVDEATAARLTTYDLQPGDLVMTRKGTIGNCAIYPASLPTGVMHSDLLRARISPLAADVVFLEHHLQLSLRISHQIKMMSPGAVMPGINVTKLKQLAVDTPPIGLQHVFATRVSVIGRQRAVVRRAISADDALFASLQSLAFRGEL